MKVIPTVLAIALASIVLPVPAGPYKSIPLGGSLIFLKYPLSFNGATTLMLNESLAYYNPAISSNETFSFLTIKSYSIDNIKPVSGPSP
jgi:hypothetical protein